MPSPALNISFVSITAAPDLIEVAQFDIVVMRPVLHWRWQCHPTSDTDKLIYRAQIPMRATLQNVAATSQIIVEATADLCINIVWSQFSILYSSLRVRHTNSLHSQNNREINTNW